MDTMRTSITYLGTRACRLRSASVTSIGSLPGAGAEDAAWREEYARAHDEDEFDRFRMSQFVSSKFSRMVHDLELQRQGGLFLMGEPDFLCRGCGEKMLPTQKTHCFINGLAEGDHKIVVKKRP
jgi:hypothetical protein